MDKRWKALWAVVLALNLSGLHLATVRAQGPDRAASTGSQTSQQPSANQNAQPKPRLRTFGRLPDWAKRSWFIRRQLDSPWMLQGVNVIDVRTGKIQQNVNIVIAGDQIESIGDAKPSAEMKVIDAAGKYVIPGLFDLHAHVIPKSMFFPAAPEPEEALRMLLDSGVTTIRALPFYSESGLLWAARVNHDDLTGPTIVPASSIFEKEAQRTSRGFGDPETVARFARKRCWGPAGSRSTITWTRTRCARLCRRLASSA